MAAKFYQVEKVINNKKYVAQFGGMSLALDAIDSSYIDGTSTTSVKKLNKFLLDHVIVEPKGLTVDDFETVDEMNEVTKFAREVMQGNFRDKAHEGAADAKGSR